MCITGLKAYLRKQFVFPLTHSQLKASSDLNLSVLVKEETASTDQDEIIAERAHGSTDHAMTARER